MQVYLIIYMSESGKRLASEIDRIGGITPVAKRLGTVRNTIYNWLEKGNIPLNKLEELGAAGADIVFIITGQHSPALLAPDEQILLQAYRTLDPGKKAGALGAVAGLQQSAQFEGSMQVFNQAPTGDIAGRDIVKKGKSR
jgi:hypothetical protein